MEKQMDRLHEIQISNRERGTLTGVIDVLAFDEERIMMETTRGMLTIRGSKLHVCRLELEKGEAQLEGTVDSLTYTQKNGKKKKGSLIRRLFQ